MTSPPTNLPNGADALIAALTAQGVDTCFANPGTTEMHLVGALGRATGVRTHLCLFEGVATGAADGFARMAGRPAMALLHLGPGLANGMANLHNAKKAGTPVVTVVGEHATYHLAHDAPLTADIETMAGTVSDRVLTLEDATRASAQVSDLMAEVAAGRARVTTIVVPNDVAWSAAELVTTAPLPLALPDFDRAAIAASARALRRGREALLLLGAPHITARMAALATAIGAATGCTVLTEPVVARMARGRDAHPLNRQPFHVDFATEALKHVAGAVLVGARPPVAFFAYPGRPSRLLPDGCEVTRLCPQFADVVAALEALAAELGVTVTEPVPPPAPVSPAPDLPVDAATLGAAVAATLPEGAIVIDESITNGLPMYAACAAAAPHDWINNLGGSIGYSMPVAVGAAAACPGRRVLCVTGDGSAAYTPQALWTMARSRLDVTVVILANRSYRILANEMSKIGAGSPDAATLPMMDLTDPAPDWVALATGYGVPAVRVDTAGALTEALARAHATPGPHLIEALMP